MFNRQDLNVFFFLISNLGDQSNFIEISDGGTGAVTASAARTNLDVDSKAETTTKAVNNGITFAIALG